MRASLWTTPTFNEKKATQAAAQFLKLADRKTMHYMLLIKLLYILDRRALLRWGRPVTGDTYFSMKYGPVLGEVLSLVSEVPDPEEPGYWTKHISEPRAYAVKLSRDPGDSELSEAEEGLIRQVFQKYGHYDRFELAKLLHRILPEWKPIQSGRSRITYADILRAENKSDEQISAIERDLEGLAVIRSEFSPR